MMEDAFIGQSVPNPWISGKNWKLQVRSGKLWPPSPSYHHNFTTSFQLQVEVGLKEKFLLAISSNLVSKL